MKPGTTIGYYKVVEEIAKGGMGTVYRAHDRALDRDVALKFLLSPEEDEELKPDDMKRFKREARVTARLRHPHIVAILGAGAHEGRPFIVMDLIEGHTLADEIGEKGAFNQARAARIAWKLAEALQYAHEQGILHRDVKPENVLMTPAGEPVLTDFGVGKAMGRDTSITVTGEIAGTPIYMPPEQATARSDLIGPRSDIYALGGTLYEMLTGQPPVKGKRVMEILEQVLNKAPETPSQLNPDVDPELERIALKCLEKDLDLRYADAQALADELRDYARDRGAAPELAGVSGEVAHQRFLVGLLVGLAVGGLLWALISGIMVRAKLGVEKERARQAALWLQESATAGLDAGDWAGALRDFNRALELAPDLADCRLGRGRALREQGRLDEALEELTQAAALAPDSAPIYVERARLHRARGDKAALLADLQRLEELGHPDLEAVRAELLSR
jgi:serine/threonine-protein kinase